MKTLGLIGGLSWFSTAIYYKTINEMVNERLGGAHSAQLLLYSIDFDEFKVLQEKNNWDKIEDMFTTIALKLQRAGADCIIMATNTPHLIADTVRGKINIPLLHIAEETGKDILKHDIKKVGLLGTKFTMEHSFFKERLANFGIETIIPNRTHRDFVHTSIFDELTNGVFKEDTKKRYAEIINELKADGAEAVVFGCTEISLLIKPEESGLPVFDTAAIHAKAAVDFALSTI